MRNEIWSINIIQHEKHIFLKNHTQIMTEKLFPDLFPKNQN